MARRAKRLSWNNSSTAGGWLRAQLSSASPAGPPPTRRLSQGTTRLAALTIRAPLPGRAPSFGAGRAAPTAGGATPPPPDPTLGGAPGVAHRAGRGPGGPPAGEVGGSPISLRRPAAT